MRGLVLIVAAVAALAVTGCGGGGGDQLTNDEYANKLQDILTPLGKSLGKLQATARSTPSQADLTSALDEADTALQTATEQVADLDPPSDAADANDSLEEALSTYEKSVGDTLETVKSGSAKEVKAQAHAFEQTSRQFASSLKQIKGQLASEGVKVAGG